MQILFEDKKWIGGLKLLPNENKKWMISLFSEKFGDTNKALPSRSQQETQCLFCINVGFTNYFLLISEL